MNMFAPESKIAQMFFGPLMVSMVIIYNSLENNQGCYICGILGTLSEFPRPEHDVIIYLT
jgi:hypothetical protein